MRVSRAALVTAIAALALGLTACGTSTTPASAPSTKAELSGTLVVDAAASLTESFQRLGERFHAEHPGVTVTFNFGGSSGLAAQIVSGAPVDVFDPFRRVTRSTRSTGADSVGPSYAVAVGLAMLKEGDR